MRVNMFVMGNRKIRGPSPYSHMGALLAFSFVINLLYLIGPIFMMQVYDRVLPSGSVPTLVGLLAIAALLYLLFGVMDHLRSQLVISRGEAFADSLSDKAFHEAVEAYALDRPDAERRQAIEDVSVLRRFMISPGMSAVVDLAFMPIFLIFIFLLHAALGVAAVAAAGILIALAVLNERISRSGIAENERLRGQAHRWVLQVQRQADLVLANGMVDETARVWRDRETAAREGALDVGVTSSLFTSGSRTFRLFVQSLILALGAYLAIIGEMSAGAMIAASIVFSRTLAPVEQVLAQFANMLAARNAWQRIQGWIVSREPEGRMPLPAPKDSIRSEILTLSPPSSEANVLRDVKFELKAGQVLGIIGPSGGGKSSLARALAGAWHPSRGEVLLDGASLRDWPLNQLAEAIGYMPQECELLDGTIAQNVSGFTADTESEAVLAACQLSGAHKMILALPNGYNTLVGPSGQPLSAGQRQRISLARALFGNPFLVVLDEPNSNLDDQGEAALTFAIRQMKSMNKIVVVVAHRQRVLQEATHMALIEDGALKVFGPRAAVLSHLSGRTPEADAGRLSA